MGHRLHSVQSLLPNVQFGWCFGLLFILNVKISPHTDRLNALLCCHLLPSSFFFFLKDSQQNFQGFCTLLMQITVKIFLSDSCVIQQSC